VGIALVFRPINPGVEILFVVICIFGMHQVCQIEIGYMCHVIDDGLKGLCHSIHYNPQRWFTG
jgi:hypothetical protein